MRIHLSFREAIGAALVLGSLVLVPAETHAGPVANASRTAVTFGYTPLGVPSPVQPVFITNTGDAALTITGMPTSGTYASDFAIAGTCTPPVALDPGERCRIDITMHPTSRSASTFAAHTATLDVQSDAVPPLPSIGLHGIVDPVFTVVVFEPTPEWIDFGPQPVGSTAPALNLNVRNAVSLTFALEQFSLVGPAAGDFTLTSNCAGGQSLGPQQSCTGAITFTPQAAGPRSAELVTQMTYSGEDGIYRYSITGVGVNGPTGATPVVEYYNAALDHYFLTWVPAEQAALDAGNTPTRWARTGYSFKTYVTAQAGTSNVCRYYIPPDKGDSHFFGRGTAECDATGLNNPTFLLEDPAFMHMFLPVAGVCPADTRPIYRVFSNRRDANHRYMTDVGVRQEMIAKGWLPEGDGPDLVAMCAPT